MNPNVGFLVVVSYAMLTLASQTAYAQPVAPRNCNPTQGPVSVTCDSRVRTDGSNPDATTAGIQSIIHRHSRVVIPAGLYTIACRNKKNRDCTDASRNATDSAIQITEGKRVHLAAGAMLQAEIVPNAKGTQIMFRLMGNGPVLSGDSGSVIDMRGPLQPPNHCQFGIWIDAPRGEQTLTSKATVTGPIAVKNAAGRAAGTCGDGIYIGGRRNSPHNVRVTGTHIEGNWRQGISITNGRSLSIERNRLFGTRGTNPGCGIDLEPSKGQAVHQVRIVGNLIEKNKGCGIALQGKSGSLREVDVIGNIIKNGGPRGAVRISGTGTSAVRVTGNIIYADKGYAAYVRGIRDTATTHAGPVEIAQNLFIWDGAGASRSCLHIDDPGRGLTTKNVRVEGNIFSGCGQEAIELDLTSPNFRGNLEEIDIRRNFMLNNAGRGHAVIGILHNGFGNTARRITIRENTILENRGKGLQADHAIDIAQSIPKADKETWDVGDNVAQGNWATGSSGISPGPADRGQLKSDIVALALAGNGKLAPECPTAGSVCVVRVSCAVSNCNTTLTAAPTSVTGPVYVENTGSANQVTLLNVPGKVQLRSGANVILNPRQTLPLAFMKHQNRWVQLAPKASN